MSTEPAVSLPALSCWRIACMRKNEIPMNLSDVQHKESHVSFMLIVLILHSQAKKRLAQKSYMNIYLPLVL